ncbi:MAG: hypothetical protein QE271_08000 [Bacteriovoracaceae bacterium]|nr:hypothetical protein [Bacteriovoracaceae bacterium]
MKKFNGNYKQMTNLLLITLVFIVSGCATESRSVGLGGLIGAGSGAAIGGIIDPGKKGEYRTRNVVIGATFGGIAGSLAGSSMFNSSEKRKQDSYEKGKLNAKEAFSKQGSMPELKDPKVESRWVEGRVQGNRYIDGHFEYIITEPARWDVE